DDVLEGGSGADRLVGGQGSDAASYQNAHGSIIVDLSNLAANGGEAVGDTFDGIEILIGSTFDDVLRGDSSDNILEGGRGADLTVGAGGVDTASYAHAPAGVIASLINPALNTGVAAGDTYSGIENLAGTDFADTLIGQSGNNRLNGGKGDDLLVGGGGA